MEHILLVGEVRNGIRHVPVTLLRCAGLRARCMRIESAASVPPEFRSARNMVFIAAAMLPDTDLFV